MVQIRPTGRMVVYALAGIILPLLSSCAGGPAQAKTPSGCTAPAPTSFAERHGEIWDTNTVSAREVHLLSESQGWVLTDNDLLWTVDCGQHWQRITPPGILPLTIGSAFFLDATHGWLSAGYGHPTVFRTTDGGKHWDATPAPGNGYLWFVDKETGWLSWAERPGGEVAANWYNGHLYRTHDGGLHWSAVAGPNGRAVYFISPSFGWSTEFEGLSMSLSGNVLVTTNDGGDSWTKVKIQLPAGHEHETPLFELPTFLTETDGVLPVTLHTSTFPQSITGAIYSTNDGGRTWSLRSMLSATRTARQAVFDVIDRQTWMVAFTLNEYGGTDVIHMTADGGRTWNDVVSRGLPMVGDLHFASHRVGWAVPSTYTCALVGSKCSHREDLLLTVDGGHSWAALNLHAG